MIHIKKCVKRILQMREYREIKAGNYQELVNFFKWKSIDSKGFWEQAKEI